MPEKQDAFVHSPESTSRVEITLKYDGKDVDDGTMPIEDVISALRGFSNAYGKLASSHDPQGQHQIRVSAIRKSSFAVSIIAWAAEHKEIIAASVPVAAGIVKLILKLIELKKRTKGQAPASVTIGGDNNIVIMPAGDNTQFVVSKDVYELYQSRGLDADLSKITAPLRQGKVDAVSLSARRGETEPIEEPVVITSSEKTYFQPEDGSATTTSAPTEISGQLISLNKESNRGIFRMENGRTVRYHLSEENAVSMYTDFAYRGPVRVQCVATFDDNLDLKGIEINEITRLQPPLFDHLPSS